MGRNATFLEVDIMLDVIIIGAGPAGLTAAIYASRAGYDALTIECAGAGGQVLSTYEVDNYPALKGISGMELGTKMKEHAISLGARIVYEKVVDVDVDGEIKKVVTDAGTYEARNIVIASGASHAKLDIPGEEELAGVGVSYCATCDGAFYKDADVAVVGGGDVAVEDAIFLARACSKVYLIHRRDSLRAADSLQKQLMEKDNIEIIWDTTVSSIDGDGEVEGLTLKNVKTGEESNLAVEGVFVAVGINPVTALFEGKVDMNEKGYILAGEDCKTNIPGVLVAGDARSKALRQIVTAVADGANAIESMK